MLIGIYITRRLSLAEREIWRGQSVLESVGLELERVRWESE